MNTGIVLSPAAEPGDDHEQNPVDVFGAYRPVALSMRWAMRLSLNDTYALSVAAAAEKWQREQEAQRRWRNHHSLIESTTPDSEAQ